jgi:hypothetical protein
MVKCAPEDALRRWPWIVSRTFAWVNQFRRLRVRDDRRGHIHDLFPLVGCAWIRWQSLRKAKKGYRPNPLDNRKEARLRFLRRSKGAM